MSDGQSEVCREVNEKRRPMRYRLKADHSVKFEGKREWSGSIIDQGFVYVGQTGRDHLRMPAWLFEMLWEPVPEEKPAKPQSAFPVVDDDWRMKLNGGNEAVLRGPGTSIENELDDIAQWKGGCVFDLQRMDSALKLASAEIRKLRQRLRNEQAMTSELESTVKRVRAELAESHIAAGLAGDRLYAMSTSQSELAKRYEVAKKEILKLRQEVNAYIHGNSLAEAALEEFKTDCSTPAFIMARTAVAKLHSLRVDVELGRQARHAMANQIVEARRDRDRLKTAATSAIASLESQLKYVVDDRQAIGHNMDATDVLREALKMQGPS